VSGPAREGRPERDDFPSPPEGGPDLVAGPNAVLAALKSRPGACRALMLAEGRRLNAALEEILALARGLGLPVKRFPRRYLDRLYDRDRHQGLLAVFDARVYVNFEDFAEKLPAQGPALLLVLDRVEDPGNLGALMRSALVFGAAGVITPRERSAPLTPAALRAAAGAADHLPLARAVNLRRALESLQKMGFWILGAEGRGGRSLFDFTFPPRSALVLGSEGRGLSPLIKKTCDALLEIPQQNQLVSSLNVSAAGAVLLAEYFRQLSAGQRQKRRAPFPRPGP
jgi:23S rRNA (guanosine2251-2'-O)-methyltransferase